MKPNTVATMVERLFRFAVRYHERTQQTGGSIFVVVVCRRGLPPWSAAQGENEVFVMIGTGRRRMGEEDLLNSRYDSGDESVDFHSVICCCVLPVLVTLVHVS